MERPLYKIGEKLLHPDKISTLIVTEHPFYYEGERVWLYPVNLVNVQGNTIYFEELSLQSLVLG
jgi:hypothetical protein